MGTQRHFCGLCSESCRVKPPSVSCKTDRKPKYSRIMIIIKENILQNLLINNLMIIIDIHPDMLLDKINQEIQPGFRTIKHNIIQVMIKKQFEPFSQIFRYSKRLSPNTYADKLSFYDLLL